jgi:CRISPR/Cas system-associated protein endoribonuclease Cas2
MKIKIVPRSEVRITKKTTSKYRALIEALSQLKPDGQAIEASYTTDKEFAAMRNVVYTYNRENNVKVRSSKDSTNSKVYYYINK